ncbi:hypothetical protein AGOR_G00219220 [Albula goreensis]|uniref:Ig-like domain-containing protein n=1 Tax=Albula goreensis TaxID=1534307 RepID=A0A8T3CJQ5_9TELE|nr:hypothetical protein AGOR_G00219220 [Albula goreensis]
MGVFLRCPLLSQNRVRTSTCSGPEWFLTALLFCFSVLPSSGTDHDDGVVVTVKFPRLALKKQEGDTLKVSCTVTYNQQKCGRVNAYWCKLQSESTCVEFNKSSKYFIEISETKDKQNNAVRNRVVAMEIKNLTGRDNGTFQCNGECKPSGESSRGNFMHLSVQKADRRGKLSLSSGIHRVESVPTRLCYLSLMLLMSHML